MLFLRFFIGARQSARLLKLLPPYFDQLIRLPLPFMSSFIADAYSTNPAAARKTITYLTTQTNQQPVAAQAMALIATQKLTQCQSTQAIADAADGLAWIPSPAPKGLESLQMLVELSQGVREAVNSSSLYRKLELLKTRRRQLESIEQNLAVQKNARMATQFGAVVQQWKVVLQTAQKTLTERIASSTEIPQVYIAGQPVEVDAETSADNRFQGRQDLFREIETLSSTQPPPVLLLYGGRRSGKTSALKQLPRKIGPDIIPLYVDVQGVASATTLVGMAQSFSQSIAEAARNARNVQLRPPENYEFEKDPFLRLQKWLAEAEKIVPSKRFLLCLDEFEKFEELVNETGTRAPLNFIRSITQHRQRWILLFSGSHHLDELNPYWDDYLIGTRALEVSYLSQSEAEELIRHPIETFPNIYTDETILTITQLTRCQPYFVQLICFEIVELLNKLEKAKATPEEVEAVIPKVLVTGGSTFRERLRTLAESDRSFLMTQAHEAYLTATNEQQPIVRRLIRKDIIEAVGDRYQFQIPLFQRFVQKWVDEGW